MTKLFVFRLIGTLCRIIKLFFSFEKWKKNLKKKRNKKQKGGKSMKFQTIIGLVVGAITLIAAGAAAMYVFLEGFPCCRCKDEDEDDLYDDFPEEEIITDSDPEETEPEDAE